MDLQRAKLDKACVWTIGLIVKGRKNVRNWGWGRICAVECEGERMKYWEWRVGVLCFTVKSDTTPRYSPDRHTAQLEYYLTEKDKLTNKHHYNSEKRLSASGSQVVSDSPLFITIRNTRENDILLKCRWERARAVVQQIICTMIALIRPQCLYNFICKMVRIEVS